ncbi:hypothetical protein HNY73_009885 [Argiope bruennichi]|uniref:Uncharacterized protein n=1 Tax=Argiope bruennichi TaxID=94029 RepID=A0A8T0FGF2_ARGBR|nr:hypothetical protein HNY73_009885 [Argiope bruennichi]
MQSDKDISKRGLCNLYISKLKGNIPNKGVNLKLTLKIENPVEISDPSKRDVDKEKLKIYRLVAEHIGPSDAKTSNDSPKYDSVEFEEKKISAVQEVATSSPDVNQPAAKRFTRVYSESYHLPRAGTSNGHSTEVPSAKVLSENSDQEDDDELNPDYDAADIGFQEDAKNFQRVPSQMRMSTKIYKEEFVKSYVPTDKNSYYKEFYNQNYVPTKSKVYEIIENQGHSLANTYKERENDRPFAENYDEKSMHRAVRSTTYNNLSLRDFEKFLRIHNLKRNNNDSSALRKPAFKTELITQYSLPRTENVGNYSQARIINNTGGETIIEEDPMEIDIKTDPSTDKVNFRFLPYQGRNISQKVERKSLTSSEDGNKKSKKNKGKTSSDDSPVRVMLTENGLRETERSIDNQTLMLNFSYNKFPEIDDVFKITKPLLKIVRNPLKLAPLKLNPKPRDDTFVFVEKPFKSADSGNGVFYVEDTTERLEHRDTYFMQALKSNTIAVSFIMILIIVIIILFLYAVCSLGKNPQSCIYKKQDGRFHPGDGSEVTFYKRWWHYKFGKNPSAGCDETNPLEDKSSPFHQDSEESDLSEEGKLKNITNKMGNESIKDNWKCNMAIEKHHGFKNKKERPKSRIHSKRKTNSKSSGKGHHWGGKDEYDSDYFAENIAVVSNPKACFNFDEHNHEEQPTREHRNLFNIFRWMQKTLPSKNIEESNEESKFRRANKRAENYSDMKTTADPAASEVSAFDDSLGKILKCPKITRLPSADSDSDYDQPSRQKAQKASRQRRRSSLKKSKFRAPSCDLESIISYEADLSTDGGTSFGPNLKSDPENLKMKMMTTGEIKEIDEMLVGNDWNRRVYGADPFKATNDKAVAFSTAADATCRTSQDTSPLSVTTKESTRSLEKELGKSLHKAEDVIRRGKPLSKKEFNIK